MSSRKLPLTIGLILIALSVGACKEDYIAATIAEESSASVNEPSKIGEEQFQVGDEASEPGDKAPQAGDEKPTPREELSATHPGSVNLGSGRVTLLEFFAYW